MLFSDLASASVKPVPFDIFLISILRPITYAFSKRYTETIWLGFLCCDAKMIITVIVAGNSVL